MTVTNLPQGLLRDYFASADIKVSAKKFDSLYSTICSQQSDQPLVCLNLLFQQLDMPGYRAALIPWQRIDRRLLPAPMFYDNQWWLAENGDDDSVLLKREEHSAQLTMEDADKHGMVLWIRQPKSKSSADTQGATAGQLIRSVIFQNKAWIGNVAIATIVINVFAIFTSLFAMQVYDRVVPTLAYATLATLVAGMGIVIALDWVLKRIRAKIIDSLAADVDSKVSQQIFEHLLTLRLDRQPGSIGTLNAQVNSMESVRQFFTSGIIFGLIDLPFAFFFIAVISVIGGAIGWVYGLFFPIALLLGLVVQLLLSKLIRERTNRSNERQGLLIDSVRGAETIRSNNAGWRFSQEWHRVTQSIANYSVRQKSLSHFASSTTASLSTVAYITAIVVGVTLIEAGDMTMGALIACSILGSRVLNPVAQSVNNLIQWQSVSHSLEMVNELLAKEPERRPQQSLLFLEKPITTLSLEKVRFSYENSPTHQFKTNGLSFKAGERVLLLGPVGCGKSTLLKLLAGLYRPSEGVVKVDNIDLWEVDPRLLNTQISYLPQQVHLFKGSLKENLSLSGTVSDNHIMGVANELGVDSFAQNHPLGMDMPLAEGGEGLSGGQRQLVALNRVIASQPRIWLLDEPTSSLDLDTEKSVWQVIQKHLRPDDILIVSTHRPMQAANVATRILMIKDGEVLRDGSPAELFPNQFSPLQTQSVNKHVI